MRDASELGGLLRELRGDLTQTQAAVAVGVGQSTISAWETGREPSLAWLRKLLDVFGATVEQRMRAGNLMVGAEASESRSNRKMQPRREAVMGKAGTGKGSEVVEVATWDAFSDVFARYGKLKAKLAGLVAWRDRAMLKVKQEFASEVAEPKTEADGLQATLETWLREHKSELGELAGRFRDLPAGRVGFRRTPEKVVCVPGSDWDTVLELCRGDRKKFGGYLAVKESVDVRALLEATDAELRALGLVKVQEDRPYLHWMGIGGIDDEDGS